jgi:hypothetical protein
MWWVQWYVFCIIETDVHLIVAGCDGGEDQGVLIGSCWSLLFKVSEARSSKCGKFLHGYVVNDPINWTLLFSPIIIERHNGGEKQSSLMGSITTC